MIEKPNIDTVIAQESEVARFKRSRRARNWVMAACLLALMALFYGITVVRFGETVHKALGTGG